jgi:GT2 family glycosyltransferase
MAASVSATPAEKSEGSAPPVSPVSDQYVVPIEFDEIAYLEAYPDIALAVQLGEWTSGLHHYRIHGARENRLTDKRYIRAASGCTPTFPAATADRFMISDSGLCLISGWILDNDAAPLRQLLLRQNQKELGATRSIGRFRRNDTEQAEPYAANNLVGFWTMLELQQPPSGDAEIQLALMTGKERNVFPVNPTKIGEERLRDDALLTVASSKYFDDPETATFLQLDKGLGEQLIDLNATIVNRIAQGAYRMRFGERRTKYVGSVIVVLYGKSDFLTLQAALFSQCPGYDEYEYIYVSNSPELNDILVKDAINACRLYGVSITLILLPGNAGFGVANNVAVSAAETDRVLLINPDVLPREPYWPRIHAALVDSMPAEQTTFFGVPLYYGDGSLMHGGMHIDLHGGCSVQNGRVIRRDILRVEHYGKGAPPGSPQFVTARRVPAVTGAFMSIDRRWFEQLGGFSPKFIFGHYEDADLCLRSLEAGAPVWLHDLPFLHLESAGAKHLPVHDGARLVNRWHLTSKWADVVRAELSVRVPARVAN